MSLMGAPFMHATHAQCGACACNVMTCVTRAPQQIRMHSTGDPISTNPLSRFKQLPPSISHIIEIAGLSFRSIRRFHSSLTRSNLARILHGALETPMDGSNPRQEPHLSNQMQAEHVTRPWAVRHARASEHSCTLHRTTTTQ